MDRLDPKHDVDYDCPDTAQRYAATRGLDPATLARWLTLFRTHASLPVEHILDLGCGTGRFTGALATHFDAQATGVDPSEAMLAIARAQTPEPVTFVRGAAEAIPLPDATVDLVLISMVWHHLEDAPATVTEVARVLRTGGRLFVRTSTRDRLDDVPYHDWFPEARAINARRLPAIAEIVTTAADAGLTHVATTMLEQTITPTGLAYLDRLRNRGYSDLRMISEDAFAQGVKRAEDAMLERGESPVVEPVDLVVVERR